MRNDVLLDVATFLARRWSGNSKIVISLTRDIIPTAKPEKSQIILPVIDYFAGTDFQKYRQWRVSLWYESMRMTYSSKVLSYEHAFGFLLNTIEKKRVEFLGLQQWQGMVKEIIFNDSISWLSRPLLNSLYGRHKIVEAFSQYFLTGYIKGELFGSEFNRVKTSSDFANSIVEQAIKDNQGTNWIEQHIPKLIKMLEIDPLISIPIIAPRTRIGMSINRSDLLKQIENVLNTKYKPDEIDTATKKVVEGNDVLSE
ncbi:MAG: VWA domain-containing protein, partial [Nitrososphaeraceae archaeon]